MGIRNLRDFGLDLPMATDDFFRSRLDQMIDLRHPLAVLASKMPWCQIEEALAPVFERKTRQGKSLAYSEKVNAFNLSDCRAFGKRRLLDQIGTTTS